MKILLTLFILLQTGLGLFGENRVALLVANSQYSHFSSLAGPVPEAQNLARTLRSLGFEVRLVENGTREKILDELDALKSRVNNKGGIAFFHYGGHGVQSQGRNFLIPVEADIPDEKKLSTRAVDVDEVMSTLDSCGSDTNIVILDACRNNPLPAGSGRSASRGLTVVGTKPKNSVIVYSAEAGTVAEDGLFTPTLARYLGESSLPLTEILQKVRKEVFTRSNGRQIPGEYNQLFDQVVLKAGPAPVQPAPDKPLPGKSSGLPVKKITYPSGNWYEGEADGQVKSGRGTFHWTSGNRYEGEFTNDKMEGQGIFYFSDGDRYEGSFVNEQRSGQGTFYYKSGERYEGQYKNDKMNGWGTYYYLNGNHYEGEFINDVKVGRGTFFWTDGDKYTGEFLNDKMNGQGTFLYHNGNRYIGGFVAGVKSGKGAFSFASGDHYEGEFLNDVRNGIGTYTFADGRVQSGQWKDDKYVGP